MGRGFRGKRRSNSLSGLVKYGYFDLSGRRGKRTFFYGKIEELFCRKENRLLTIEVRGIGATKVLDQEKKSQSFQRRDMTYKQVVSFVMQQEKAGNFLWMLGEDRAIETPLLQYQETDWEFLKRISSHFNGKLIADLKTGKPDFFLGMCYGKRREAEECEIVGLGIPSAYFEKGCYRAGLPRSQSFCLEVRTKKNWQMGDSIFYKGKSYQVFERKIIYESGELFCTYYLGARGMYYQERIYAANLAGTRLEGTIRKCEGESVYLQLDIDSEERAEYPWDWIPETNNLSYCMPEIGTKAVLYLPTREEKDGQVILSAIRNEKKEYYENSQNREFFTKDKKRLGLYPERLFLEGKNGEERLSLEDQEGVRLCSEKDIFLRADGEIQISGKVIKEVAPVEIVCRTASANIEICRDFNFYAPEKVHMIGTEEGIETEEKEERNRKEKKRKIENWQILYRALGALPEVDLSSIHKVSDIVSLFALGSIPKVGRGATVVALAEVMEGKKEEEMTFPSALHSMENHVITGGYPLPDEEDEEENLQEDISAPKNRFQAFSAIGKRYVKREIEKKINFQKLVYFIMEIEDPFYDYNFVFEETEEGERKKVGIKPFSASDGYITVGYGHSIQSPKEAEKYGLNIKDDNYKNINIWEIHDSKEGYEMIKNYIKVQMSLYEKSGLKNPAILSIEEAEKLLKSDLDKFWGDAEEIVNDRRKNFTYNQVAALASLLYNGNEVNNEDSLSYQFLNKTQKDAINKLKEAVEKGWYAGQEGLLWRRLRECNIFYFNDYTNKNYENTPEGIENLKKKLGWYE